MVMNFHDSMFRGGIWQLGGIYVLNFIYDFQPQLIRSKSLKPLKQLH
jgi:hypothetical protein